MLQGYRKGEFAFAAYVREWLEQYVKDKLRSNTYKTHRTALENHAIPYFGGISIHEIKPLMYQKFIDSLGAKNLSTESARRVHNVCFQALKRVVINNYIEKNLAENVQIRKKQVQKLKYLEPTFLNAMYPEIYKRGHVYGVFFKFLFESGARKGEAAALKWPRVDWKNDIIYIEETLDFQPEDPAELFGSTKKEGSVLALKIQKSFMKELQEHLKYQNQRKLPLSEAYRHDLNLIFCQEDGSSPSQINIVQCL